MAKPTAKVFYGSNSGNTRMVAEWIAEKLSRQYKASLFDVAHAAPRDLEDAALLVFASNTWLTDLGSGPQEGQLPSQWVSFAAALKKSYPLEGRRVAIVALGRHEYTNFCAAADHLQALVARLGGHLVGEPLRVDGFPHHQRSVVDEWVATTLKSEPKPTLAPTMPEPPTTPNPGRRDPAAGTTAPGQGASARRRAVR